MEKERIEHSISFGIYLAATRFGYRSLVSLVHSLVHIHHYVTATKSFLILIPSPYDMLHRSFEQGIKL